MSVSGHGGERVPREGPAGGVPHQGQQGPGGVPAGDGAGQREPHRRAGRRPAQPLQEVSPRQEDHPPMVPSPPVTLLVAFYENYSSFLLSGSRLSLHVDHSNATVTIVTLQQLQLNIASLF